MLPQVAVIVALALTLPLMGMGEPLPRQPSSSIRHAKSDLEIIDTRAVGATRTHYLSRTFLTSLPQVSFDLQPDENFPELSSSSVHITGVALDTLIQSLASPDQASPPASLVAVCRDGYTSPFPRHEIIDHHPILIYAMDDLSPHAWSLKHHAYDAGPYFISYANFVPSFRLLAHDDFPQHPAEIVRLKLVANEDLFAAIKPPVSALPHDSPISSGFRIAQQNCFRCHNAGDTGGTKAQRTWQHLAKVAKSRPDYFARWVHNPQSIDPGAKMPPNLKYDQPTLNALTRYFQAFTP